MPRKARLRAPGLPLHVIQRGNNRTECFRTPADHAMYLRLLSEARERESCVIHAYVLMSNHVHLLVTAASRDGVSRLMKRVGQAYVPYFNRTYGRTGTLWEGRFRSSIVDSDRYLLACYRYIELNPVRAGMVERPGEYRWSSYGANALGRKDDLVTPHAVYLSLASSFEARLASYRNLCGTDLTDDELNDIRAAANGGFALGSREFVQRLERALGRRVERMSKGRQRVSQATAVSDADNSGLSPVV
jgi:putative transposase